VTVKAMLDLERLHSVQQTDSHVTTYRISFFSELSTKFANLSKNR
jgi:hypothetical protein